MEKSGPRFPSGLSEEKIFRQKGYIMGRLLGEGSYAKVYYSEFTDADGHIHKLACKVINVASAPKEFVRKFFPREVDIISKIQHPHLVRVHSILQRRQKYFMYMTYAENGDLLEYIRRNGAVVENQARIWFGQMVQGVEYLHGRDIAHRDLKCENMLLTSSLIIKIGDFGFARHCRNPQGGMVLSTTYCGSVSYASPEIIRGVPYDCKKADVWSLGIVLYIMMNKSMPFEDTNTKKLLEKQLQRHWKFRTKVDPVITEDAKVVVRTILEPDSDTRPNALELWQLPWLRAYLREVELASAKARQTAEAAAESTAVEGEEEGAKQKQKPAEESTGPLIRTSTMNMLKKSADAASSRHPQQQEQFVLEGRQTTMSVKSVGRKSEGSIKSRDSRKNSRVSRKQVDVAAGKYSASAEADVSKSPDGGAVETQNEMKKSEVEVKPQTPSKSEVEKSELVKSPEAAKSEMVKPPEELKVTLSLEVKKSIMEKLPEVVKSHVSKLLDVAKSEPATSEVEKPPEVTEKSSEPTAPDVLSTEAPSQPAEPIREPDELAPSAKVAKYSKDMILEEVAEAIAPPEVKSEHAEEVHKPSEPAEEESKPPEVPAEPDKPAEVEEPKAEEPETAEEPIVAEESEPKETPESPEEKPQLDTVIQQSSYRFKSIVEEQPPEIPADTTEASEVFMGSPTNEVQPEATPTPDDLSLRDMTLPDTPSMDAVSDTQSRKQFPLLTRTSFTGLSDVTDYTSQGPHQNGSQTEVRSNPEALKPEDQN